MVLTDININERMKFYNVTGMSITEIINAEISKAEHYGLLEAGTTKIVNSHSIFNACSISKFLTSMLVMLLSEKGLVDLDEDINRKLTSWKVPDNGLTKGKYVTLRNLLSHQSGIIDPENSFVELDSNIGIPSIDVLLKGKTPYCLAPIEVKYEPESDFQYSDAGYCIIQQLIEDVTGRTFEEIVNEEIFHPLNMYNSTVSPTIPEERMNHFTCGHRKNGQVVDDKFPIYPYPAAAGLWTTPSDLAVLVIELMNSLKGQSKIGLSVSKSKEMINSQGCKEFTGLGVFLDGSERELEISSLGWGVGFQCMMVGFPYKETGLIIMTNTDIGVHQMKGIIGEVYHSFVSGSED